MAPLYIIGKCFNVDLTRRFQYARWTPFYNAIIADHGQCFAFVFQTGVSIVVQHNIGRPYSIHGQADTFQAAIVLFIPCQARVFPFLRVALLEIIWDFPLLYNKMFVEVLHRVNKRLIRELGSFRPWMVRNRRMSIGKKGQISQKRRYK